MQGRPFPNEGEPAHGSPSGARGGETGARIQDRGFYLGFFLFSFLEKFEQEINVQVKKGQTEIWSFQLRSTAVFALHV